MADKSPLATQTVVNEIANMAYEGNVKGIAVSIIAADGNLRTIFAYEEGCKLPTLAGIAVLQADFIASLTVINKQDLL